ncbi:MAG: bifunctional diaminohydroxyphosphoribosylaminopyrimidine deaminase/5-amino-6-(5-phosphoribosylamino)uracil reductase RibD [Spirochaetes bacterium]|nr:bifunctional diaminohydroxyphosphoribosylaminopyrimidine deaminase/5-amino-6-(5-phosphoribosylamino)uracil reductase RibD [Spirochaetota bacterium]
MASVTSENKRKLMELALEIGFSRMGKTSPNPPVGAVIVKNGEIISTGGTSPCGSDHAEACAIKNAAADTAGAEMYVSLEPCCHYTKRTPPCTDAIKAARIARVYVPVLDPNPEVAGKGIETLRSAGIEVVFMSDMSGRAFDLIRHFKKYLFSKTPYIIHKSAISLDGKIATKTGDSKWISSEYSRYVSHKLRSVVDGIIIGKNTMIKDDPALDVRTDTFGNNIKDFFKRSDLRIEGRESFFLEMLTKYAETDSTVSPLRIVIGGPEKIEFTKKLFIDDNYIFFINESGKESLFKQHGHDEINRLIELKNLVFVKGRSKKEQVGFILNELYSLGKMMLMVEGGGTAAGSFFDAGEIDQFIYFIAPKIIGNGTGVVEAEGKQTISESRILYDISTVMLKEDMLYNAYSEPTLGICREMECLQD